LFGPGGSLDSQTSETQWYEGIAGSQGHYESDDDKPMFGKYGNVVSFTINQANLALESQHKAIQFEEEQAAALAPTNVPSSPKVSTSSEASIFSAVEPLVQEKVLAIVKICTQRLEDDLKVVTARKDRAFRELAEEREWIRVLEHHLNQHGIPLPTYPF
jgi:hypothetical protein